jgi:aryl-alcohol dehydrogenase-like predicted oxidoreductase
VVSLKKSNIRKVDMQWKKEDAAALLFHRGIRQHLPTSRAEGCGLFCKRPLEQGKIERVGKKNSRERIREGKTKFFRQNRGKTLPPNP